MLELSNNSTSTFRSCPKKYYWRYIKGLQPYQKPSALLLGTAVHEAFDKYYQGLDHNEITKHIALTFDSARAVDDMEDTVIAKYTALGMWINYPKDLTVFSDIRPEMEFRVKMSEDLEFVGKVDGLVTYKDSLWVREVKTTSLAKQAFENRCRTSSQASAYIWGLRKNNLPVVGVIYDYIKKPALKKNKSENMHDFGTRIYKDYQERPDHYYGRHLCYRNDYDIRLFEHDIQSQVRELQRRIQESDFSRNMDSCWNFNSECPYLKICFEENIDDMTISLYFEHKPTINKGGKQNV